MLQNALAVCEQTQKYGKELEYKWTLPAYLLKMMYEKNDEKTKKRLKELVGRGQVCFHALPFTMHTSLLDEAALRKMFVFADDCCQIFGCDFPKSAKMTDVPSHTSAIIRPLVERGVKFLHLGKNPASPKPKVPLLFWWEDLEGEPHFNYVQRRLRYKRTSAERLEISCLARFYADGR